MKGIKPASINTHLHDNESVFTKIVMPNIKEETKSSIDSSDEEYSSNHAVPTSQEIQKHQYKTTKKYHKKVVKNVGLLIKANQSEDKNAFSDNNSFDNVMAYENPTDSNNDTADLRNRVISLNSTPYTFTTNSNNTVTHPNPQEVPSEAKPKRKNRIKVTKKVKRRRK